MRLYKMELYKICSRKMFLFSAAATLIILLLFMYMLAVDNYETINGVEYWGYRQFKKTERLQRNLKAF